MQVNFSVASCLLDDCSFFSEPRFQVDYWKHGAFSPFLFAYEKRHCSLHSQTRQQHSCRAMPTCNINLIPKWIKDYEGSYDSSPDDSLFHICLSTNFLAYNNIRVFCRVLTVCPLPKWSPLPRVIHISSQKMECNALKACKSIVMCSCNIKFNFLVTLSMFSWSVGSRPI